MTILKTTDLAKPKDPAEPKRQRVVMTGPNGKPTTKTPHPKISIDALDFSAEAMTVRRAVIFANLEADLEVKAKKCEAAGVKIIRRKK
jgi:hypothetical protein